MNVALLDKYGAYDADTNPTGVNVYFYNSTNIVFKCTALSPKVIKIYSAQYYASYGDEWTSGTTITNEVAFGGNNYHVSPDDRRLVLGDNLLVLASWLTTRSDCSRLIVIGNLTNGSCVCFGAYSGTYRAVLDSYNMVTGEKLGIVTLIGNIRSSGGAIYKSPIYFEKKLGGAEYNADNSLASMIGISASTAQVGAIGLSGAGYFLTPSQLNMTGGVSDIIANSLLVELG